MMRGCFAACLLGACATQIKTPTKQTPIKTTAAALAPPTSPMLTATAGDGTIMLTWNATVSATSYAVWRAVDGQTFLRLATARGPEYVDSAVSNNRPYTYEVAAIGPGGDSAMSAPVTATPLAAFDRWSLRHHSATLSQVAYGARTFVAVGHGGVVRYSSDDGVTWRDASSHVAADITRVIFDATRGFVAASSDAIITSPDGVSWTSHAPVHTDKIAQVVPNGLACNSASCVVTAVSTAFISTDLDTWSASSLPLRAADIGASESGYVVGGETNGGSAIAFASDGQSWSSTYSDTTFGVTTILGRASGFTAFVSTPSGFSVLAASDGRDWHPIANSNCANGGVHAAAVTTTQLFAVCDSRGAARVADDPAGATWARASQSLPLAAFFHGAAFGAKNVVVVGDAGAVLTVAGAEASAAVNESHLSSVAFGAGNYIAVGSNAVVYSSSDAATWVPHSAPMRDPLERVTYGAGNFWAVGDENIFSARDGVTWTAAITPLIFGRLHSVAVANDGTVIAVGDYGASSATFAVASGGAWSAYTAAALPALSDIAWGNDQFVAVGAAGTILSSDRGATASGWQARNSSVTTDFVRVIWNGRAFVALSTDGAVVSSSDAVTWTAIGSVGAGSFSALGSDGNTTFVGGLNGVLAQATHGSAWLRRFAATPSKSDMLTDILFANGVWVLVGHDALIMTKP